MSAASLDLTPKGSVEIETLVNGPIQTNSYAVISDNECVIIDSPHGKASAWWSIFEPSIPVYACLAPYALMAMPIMLVVLPAYEPPLARAASMSCVLRMWRCRMRISRNSELCGALRRPTPGRPTRLLAEGDAIEVGDICLQVIETPGHTPGGIVLFAATEQGSIAFVGDTLFPGSHGRTDLSGGDEAAILRSLSKLARLLPPDTVCLTGHGASTTMARELMQNPFMQM